MTSERSLWLSMQDSPSSGVAGRPARAPDICDCGQDLEYAGGHCPRCGVALACSLTRAG